LAEHAGVKSPATITRIEQSGRNIRNRGFAATLSAVELALEQANILFISVDGHSPGVQLLENRKRRK